MVNNIINSPAIDEALLYRRQFFLGPNYLDHLPNWIKTEIDSNHFITSHPDLEIINRSNEKSKLILLGFMFDPENPNYSNSEILVDLLSQIQSFTELTECTRKYSGRWILIHSKDDSINLFTDACGARSVFYHFNKGITWCASQPHTIADIQNNKKRDDEDFLDFINSKEFKKNENTLFGNDTIFKDIYRLLPNHYLSINEQHTKRYWPNKTAKELTVEEVIQTVAPIIKGLFKSANKRFKLIQPVTAGRDSRLLLAASKDVRQNIYFFIQKFKGLKWYSKEIRLPKKLLKYLGLDFHVVKCKEYNLKFDEYLRKNVFMLQTENKKVLYYNFFQKFQGYLNVSGNYTGIYRPLKWQVYTPPNTPLISRTYGNDFRRFRYVADYINNWEKDYAKNIAQHNYPIVDIFYWENKAANWVSMFLNELDIATEEWCPVNSRQMLETLLSVDPKIMIEENFQQKIVEHLWLDTLRLPLAKVGKDNPFRISIKKIIYNILKYIGLLNIVKKLINRRNII